MHYHDVTGRDDTAGELGGAEKCMVASDEESIGHGSNQVPEVLVRGVRRGRGGARWIEQFTAFHEPCEQDIDRSSIQLVGDGNPRTKEDVSVFGDKLR